MPIPSRRTAHRLELCLVDVADPRAVDDHVAHRRLVHVRDNALLSCACALSAG